MTPIMFVGDLHGNVNAAGGAIFSAAHQNIDKIVQAGDFGFVWSYRTKDVEDLNKVSKILRNKNVKMFFVDGNHDNHTLLQALCSQGLNEEGFCEIVPNLYYIPRGTRWTWNDIKFLGLGGAYSIDQNGLTQGVDWWPEEIISYSDIDKALGPSVDIMVTHDAPFGTHGLPSDKFRFDGTVSNQKAIRGVFDVVKPKLVVNGHYHVRNTYKLEGAIVETLDRDGTKTRNRLIIDLDKYK